jgi:branched-chain amino acid transport system ATP-binding protein
MPVLIAEQNVRRILRLADYVYILETGRIELEGEGRELLADDRIRASYLGLMS